MKPLLQVTLCAFTLTLAYSCSEGCDPLAKELSETKAQLGQRDSVLNSIGAALQVVDSNVLAMDVIKAALVQQLEHGETDKALIQENIDRLKSVMAANQAQLDRLRGNLDTNAAWSQAVKSVVQGVEEKITLNNAKLVGLNEGLGTLGAGFNNVFDDYLKAEYKRQALEKDMVEARKHMDKMEAQVRELRNDLNTAYIAIGSKRELIEAGILEKGGLLKSGSINANLDQMAFKPYDITSLESLDLGPGRVRIVTQHPSESYNLQKERGTTVLYIESPKNFWRLSKFLVVSRD